jgi:parvulin-like peptidyl-prolyl isomerase
LIRIKLIAFILLLSICHAGIAAEIPRSNSVIFSNAADNAIDEIFLTIKKDRALAIHKNEHPAAGYLGNKIAAKMIIDSVKIEQISQYSISVFVNKFEVEYNRVDANVDYFERKFSFDFTLREIQSGSTLDFVKIDTVIRDTIHYDDFALVDDFRLPFARAPLPERQPGFFERAVEPVIVGTAIIIFGILLFTVRSE